MANTPDGSSVRSLLADLADHEFLLGTLVSAALYGYARLSVALFCWQLGISPSDLDLGTEDYLLIASMWLLLFGVIYWAVRVQQLTIDSGTHSLRSVSGAAAFAIGIAAMGVAGLATVLMVPNLEYGYAVVVFLLAQLAGIVVVLTLGWVFDRKLHGWMALVPASMLALLALSSYGSWSAGNVAREQPLDDERLPIALDIVLGSSVGEIEYENDTFCVLRLAPRVFATSSGMLVLSDAPSYRVGGSCGDSQSEE